MIYYAGAFDLYILNVLLTDVRTCTKCTLSHPPARSLTHSLIDSFTHSITHRRTHASTHPRPHVLTHPLSPTPSLTLSHFSFSQLQLALLECFGRKFCTKGSFSRRKPSVFATATCSGSLARNRRFHNFNFWKASLSQLRRFYEIADACNFLFCRTQRGSEDGWGRFSARRGLVPLLSLCSGMFASMLLCVTCLGVIRYLIISCMSLLRFGVEWLHQCCSAFLLSV